MLLQLHALHGAAGRSVLRRGNAGAGSGRSRSVEPVRWAQVGDDLAPLPDAQTRRHVRRGAGRQTRDARKRLVVREFEAGATVNQS